jgi:glycosyltransferase involved in cell wall biosynthesis
MTSMTAPEARPRRILQICGTGVGGRWFLDQVQGLTDRGYDVVAIVPSEGPLLEALQAAGIRSVVIPFKGMGVRDLGRVFLAGLRLIRLMRAMRPDVVHYHLLKAIVMGRLAAAAARVPIRISQWPGDIHRSNRFLRSIDDATAALDTIVLGSSRSIANTYASRGRRSATVYYGFRTGEWLRPRATAADRRAKLWSLGLDPERRTVAMVGHIYASRLAAFRDVGMKGHEVFLEAAIKLVEAGRDVQFLVVGDELAGDGSYRSRLERSAAAGLGGRMVFAGHRSDIPALLACIDVVAIPSTSESASYGAMEALMLQCAVVASDVGGLPDTVVDGETGILVPPRDASGLATAIARLLDDPTLRERLGAQGRRHVVANFDVARSIDDLDGLYQALASETVRPGVPATHGDG